MTAPNPSPSSARTECRVFISHTTADDAHVAALATALRQAGIECFNDAWEVSGGDNFVAWINKRLEECTAGIVVFSCRCVGKPWMDREVSYLTYANVADRKRIVPVAIVESGEHPPVPPLLRMLSRFAIHETQAIIDCLLSPVVLPPLGQRENIRVHRVLVSLQRGGAGAQDVHVAVSVDGRPVAQERHQRLPGDLLHEQTEFLKGFRNVAGRSPIRGESHSRDESLRRLGKSLSRICLPGEALDVVEALVERKVGVCVQMVFESADPELLGLPFEALRLSDDRLLALEPTVEFLRRPSDLQASEAAPLPGPLKILVAVGAPDEVPGSTVAVLDHERECSVILTAVESTRRLARAAPRFLEVGSAAAIGAAFRADPYHILHLTCHGAPATPTEPATLLLEDELGVAQPTTATQLVQPIIAAKGRLPLVILNACHTGVAIGQTSSFALELLRAGAEAVLAMQTSVSDRFATRLAEEFFKALAEAGQPRPASALAAARRTLEQERQELLKRRSEAPAPASAASSRPTGSIAERLEDATTLPEYATATLFVRGDERQIVTFDGTQQRLNARTVLEMAGPVPQLGLDDLIGRRKELRETLRTLRQPPQGCAGVVITGIGGIGKSALAGRAMRRMSEDGFAVAVVQGKWSLGVVARAVAEALLHQALAANRSVEEDQAILMLASQKLPDDLRWPLLRKVLAERDLLLVLDDFEQNLTVGGEAFLDPDVLTSLEALASVAGRGRLLVTCRHPIPGAPQWLHRVPLGPLSPAEVRKLLLRLPNLREVPTKELVAVIRTIGGHPRMLEFLDGILGAGKGRLAHVTRRLNDAAAAAGLSAGTAVERVDEAIRIAVLLGARDILLDELVASAKGAGADEVLFQTAVSNLPVTPEAVAHMLHGQPAKADEVARVDKALLNLERLSLVVREGGRCWVHRWTAEGLVALGGGDEARRKRCGKAAAFRMWRIQSRQPEPADFMECLRNQIDAELWDNAADLAGALASTCANANQTMQAAQIASEVLERLPVDHAGFGPLAQLEADSHLALGATDRAVDRWRQLTERFERLAKAEPDRADFQRGLSVSYNKMGDLYSALGQGEEARKAFLAALQISERLAKAEPDRADFQRDLSVSYERMGDLYSALGQGEEARKAFLAALQISERLAKAEPDRADFQRDLSVSYNKMGDLYSALGQGEEARKAFLAALQISERLAKAEPDRADFQRDLSVSYERMGDLYSALGQGEEARKAFLAALQISERLAKAEPDRADFQRDLSVSYERMGDLYSALGQGEEARKAFLAALQISERLAKAEPDRADFQRDLSVSYERMGDLYRALGQGEEARKAFLAALQIRERLAKAEPDRADFQRDLSVSYERMGDLYRALGQGEEARKAFLAALQISERLAKAEPDRADFQRDLSVSYNKMGDLYSALGQGEEARKAFLAALQISERLAKAEPDRADFQRDLSVSYNKMGDLYSALGQGEEARKAFLAALQISERLAKAEPDRADFQRDLSVSYERMGDLYSALGQGEEARKAFLAALQISERLAKAEPDRADFQRDLSVSYERMGDLYSALGQGEEARKAFLAALQISERLAKAEPDRADFQRDLSVSYERMGDLYSALGQGEEARKAFLAALQIRERLAKAEPDRADFQRDLSVSYERMGDLYSALGQGEEARKAFLAALQIRERLAKAEPDRADFQRDLAICFERMASLAGPDAASWITQAVAIRRRILDLAPQDVIVQRELAIALFQQGQAMQDGQALAEGAARLVDLKRRGVLEAQYLPLATKLEELMGQGPS